MQVKRTRQNRALKLAPTLAGGILLNASLEVRSTAEGAIPRTLCRSKLNSQDEIRRLVP